MTIRYVSAIRTAVSFLVVLAVFAPALPGSGLSAREELPGLEVTDLWDYPESLSTIVAKGTTLFFICDPALKECREGAVFIESRAPGIREAGMRLALLLRGSGPDVRNAALQMDLDTPIYIDEDGRVIDSMLDQEILPALLLASHDGTVIETVYGGGESLAGNLERVLARGAPEPPPEKVAEPEKKSGRWKYLLGAAAIIVIGILIFAD